MKMFLPFVALLLMVSNVAGQCATTRSYSTHSYRSVYEPTIKVVRNHHVAYKTDVVVQRFIAAIPLAEFASTYAFYYPPPVPPSYATPVVPVPTPPAGPRTAPAPAISPCAATEGHMKALVAAMTAMAESQKSINAKLERAFVPPGAAPVPDPRRTPPPPAPPAGPGTPIKVIQANKIACAGCHSKQYAAEHGGDLVLSDEKGEIVRLKDDVLLSITKHISRGTMPKQNARAKSLGIGPLTEEVATAWIEEVNRQAGLNKVSRKEADEAVYVPIALRGRRVPVKRKR